MSNTHLTSLARGVILMISFLVGICNANASSESVTMNVGETKTLYLPSSITSLTCKQANFYSNSINEVEVLSHTNYSVTVKALKATTSTVIVRCDYYYYIQSGSYTYSTQTFHDWNITVEGEKPTAVSIPETYTLLVGQSVTFTPELTPTNAYTTYTWSTSNSNVASINSSTGKIIGQSSGTATITCKTANNLTATCSLTVERPQPTSVSLSSPVSLKVGESVKVTPSISPSNASTTYTWSTDNTGVATVTSNGYVYGVSVGQTYVNVETANGLTAFARVIVSNEVYNYNVKNSLGGTIATGSVAKGETVEIAYPEYILQDGTLYRCEQNESDEFRKSFIVDSNNKTVILDYVKTDIDNVVYYAEAENIAGMTGSISTTCSNNHGAYSANDVYITTLKPGTYRIGTNVAGQSGISFVFYGGSLSNILHENKTTGIRNTATSSFILKEETDVFLAAGGSGESAQLMDNIYISRTSNSCDMDGDGSIGLNDLTIVQNDVLSSSYDKASDINKDGQLDIVDIVAMTNEIAYDAVRPLETNLTFGFSLKTMNVGESTTTTATCNSPSQITYSSSNPTVATIDATTGKVIALSTGTATITASVDASGRYVAATTSFTLTVTRLTTTLSFSTKNVSLAVGDTYTQTALVETDDVAAVKWGGNWHMPTETNMNELVSKCTWTWTTDGGVKGYSVKGPNGNTIFLPAAGEYSGTTLYSAGSNADYWTKSLYTSECYKAVRLHFTSSSKTVAGEQRCRGCSVRPVANK